ncbi:MAG: ADP-ribosylglycohydrolase family protein [Armatimonadota bacterium]
MNKLDRFKGCILGLACADALGATLEFMTPAEIVPKYGELRDIVGGGWIHVAPGEYTDDTQMMLCILESIIDMGDVHPKDVSDRFVKWYQSRPKDIGSLTRSAILYAMNGMAWDDAGQTVWEDSGRNSAGNGGLMRCAPVGLFRHADMQKLAQDSRDTCRITHHDLRCQESCIALNWAIASFVQGRELDFKELESICLDPQVLKMIQTASNADYQQAVNWAQGGYTLNSLAVAFWALASFDSYEEAIIKVVNLGGDADTTGVIAGALLGAKYGIAGIPDRWLSKLQGREMLEDMATKLYDLSCKTQDAQPVPFPRSYWVKPGIFLAGFYPGDLYDVEARTKLSALVKSGIRTIIDLTEAGETNYQGKALVRYDDHPALMGPDGSSLVTHKRFAIKDMSVPTAEYMKTILDAIDASIADGKPVYAHCWGGKGRTGIVVGCWLARHGIATGDEALAMIQHLRRNDPTASHESPQTPEQCRMVRDWSIGE